jgi:hypothetical protein
MINFMHNLALIRVRNANFLAEFFGENIFKIITSVPDRLTLDLAQKFKGFLSSDRDWQKKFEKKKKLFL